VAISNFGKNREQPLLLDFPQLGETNITWWMDVPEGSLL
jgi:hypothetical protein